MIGNCFDNRKERYTDRERRNCNNMVAYKRFNKILKKTLSDSQFIKVICKFLNKFLAVVLTNIQLDYFSNS